ncbi:MAG: SLBB domain-containing protein [Gemmatimonadota bacterium]|nr:MAG: SLBB domain-containing protein [Gemmatimonadota bacterium]
MRRICIAVVALCALAVLPDLHAQQSEWNPALVGATRQYLEELRSNLENASRSQAYSEDLRARARAEAERVRTRLEEGDFRVGDRVILRSDRPRPATDVTGTGPVIDTLAVEPGLLLDLPEVGRVPLRGVLRSELESYLTDQMSRFVNEPNVRAQSYIRVSILGEVAQPGFHLIPPETPLADALMTVGGPTQMADWTRVRVERDQRVVLDGGQLQTALHTGMTLGEIEMRAGDVIVVPRRARFSLNEILGFVAVIAGTVFALQRIGII